MKKFLLYLVYMNFFCFSGMSQVKDETTLSAEETKKVLAALTLDTTVFLRDAMNRACLCTDSISLTNKGQSEISKEIAGCIEKEVIAYELSLKLFQSLHNSGDEKNISININTDKREHDQYYFDFERLLRDSCPTLSKIAAANNKESASSYSKDEVALAYYYKGEKFLKAANYDEASKYFKLAVEQDKTFAFAWDNLGVSLRNLGKYTNAIEAYNNSLAADPTGITPLQNIPVVYQFLKKYDKAIDSYKHLIEIYPKNAEGYYGAGQAYINGKEDFENALQYLCKAYNIYIEQGSPYRSDAEKIITYIYAELKKQGKEAIFNKILKENNIKTSKD